MLPQANRLTNLGDFNQLKTKGSLLKGEACSLLYFKRGKVEPWRAGIVVSKKISKVAVVRNRLKRQYRMVIRGLASRINPGYDILFLVRAKSVGLSQVALEPEIAKLLVQGKILL